MIPLALLSQTQVSAGAVSGTWDITGSPFMVNGEIYVDEGASLIIDPGVEVKFNGWFKFIVNGSLMAEGTETDKILFTAADINNRWHGIRFQGTNETSVLDYCIISYGLTNSGSSNFLEYAGGGILCYSSPNASITISNCEILNNIALRGGGIGCFNTHPEIVNSTIANNYAEEDAGGIAIYSQSAPVIRNNIIINNVSDAHGGATDSFNAGEFIFERNVVAYNQAAWGGGISFFNSDGVHNDNTIVYNQATTQAGAVWLWNNSCPSFDSDIMFFNNVNGTLHQVHVGGTNCTASFNYCDVQGGSAGFTGSAFLGTYDNCIDDNPLFADAANNDFSLTWDNYPEPDATMSPCIDAGCPGFPEPDGSCNDIGVYSYFQQLDVPVAFEPTEITENSFIANWSSSFGALGYHLDVAVDDEFLNLVYDNIEIVGATNYLVEGIEPGTVYYYRVNSFNTALISDYSNTMATTTIVSVEDFDIDQVELATYHNNLYINTNKKIESLGEVYIYNIAGQLLTHDQIHSGTNTIDTKVTNQIIMVKLIIEGKIYQKKLLMK